MFRTGLLAAALSASVSGTALSQSATPQTGISSESGFFQNMENTADYRWKTMLFGGRLSNYEIAGLINPTNSPDYTRANFVGIAVSQEVYRWKGFSIDLEGGLGYQFAPSADNNTTGHVWVAAYGRYDDFPWNHIVHTSIAGSIGLNYVNNITDFEIAQTTGGKTQRMLHYFSPEIAFSMPDNRDTELVFRIHHRSSASGAFGCDGCGSNIATVGIRHAF